MECAATASPRSPNNGSSDKHHPSAIVSTTQIKLTIHRNRQGDNVGAVPSTSWARVPVHFLFRFASMSVSTSRGRECPSCLCTLRMIRLETEASRPGGGPPVTGQCLTNVESSPCCIYRKAILQSAGQAAETFRILWDTSCIASQQMKQQYFVRQYATQERVAPICATR